MGGPWSLAPEGDQRLEVTMLLGHAQGAGGVPRRGRADKVKPPGDADTCALDARRGARLSFIPGRPHASESRIQAVSSPRAPHTRSTKPGRDLVGMRAAGNTVIALLLFIFLPFLVT